MRTVKAAVACFALVFGAGFVLGSIRVPFLVPRLGERVAELLEMPFMLVAVVLAARFATSRNPVSGGVYLAMLLLFAAMPLIVSRRSQAR